MISNSGLSFAESLERRAHLAADFGFAVTAGAGGSDRGNTLDVDAAGNAVVAGVFNGTVDFDPTAATANLAAPAKDAAFVAKYTKAGALLWARGLGGSGEQNVQAVAADAAGNVYAAGYFSGKLDADPGPGVTAITAKGGHDAFVVKLTATGQFVWARTLGGGNEEGATALDVDAAGNAYVLGMFAGRGDFNPGGGTTTLVSRGGYDAFIVKLDAGGGLRYAGSVGGGGDDFANGVSVDAGGRAVVAGTFVKSVDLDPGPATRTAYAAGGKDVFALWLDAGGNVRFGRTFGGTGDDQAGDVRVDSAGDAWVVGQFTGTADFDPSAGTAKLMSAGSTDAFVARYGPGGQYVLARRIGGRSADRATNLTVDAKRDVYVTGQFAGSVDFDPGSGTAVRTSAGGSDAFAMKLSSAGGYVWSRTVGGGSADVSEAIGLDGQGGMYAIGTFAGTADFDPASGVFKRTSAGGSDWFLWKLVGA